MLYSINAELKGFCSKENLQQILKNGTRIGYTYCAYGQEKEFESIALAAEGLMRLNIYDAIGIKALKDGNSYCISVAHSTDHFGIIIGGFNIDEINIIDGTRQFLQLINGFALLELYTIND